MSPEDLKAALFPIGVITKITSFLQPKCDMSQA